MVDLPILWSFRRCPYAIRARLAVLSSGQAVALREIKLRDKPQAFLEASASATVPALEVDGTVLDESLEIMIWALNRADPEDLLDMPDAGWALIAETDGPFKRALDHTKYAVRYPELDSDAERQKASDFLCVLNARLARHRFLMGDACTVADVAIFPFVRQFAFIDRVWFDAQPWPDLIRWLDHFLESPAFAEVMEKLPVWQEGDAPHVFSGRTA